MIAPQASAATTVLAAAQCGQRVNEWGQAGGNSPPLMPPSGHDAGGELSPACPHARSATFTLCPHGVRPHGPRKPLQQAASSGTYGGRVRRSEAVRESEELIRLVYGLEANRTCSGTEYLRLCRLPRKRQLKPPSKTSPATVKSSSRSSQRSASWFNSMVTRANLSSGAALRILNRSAGKPTMRPSVSSRKIIRASAQARMAQGSVSAAVVFIEFLQKELLVLVDQPFNIS